MKEAFVIHPYLQVYAGAEVVCLHLINALIKSGYHVRLLSDVADPEEAKRFYPEIGDVLRKVDHVKVQIRQNIVMLPGMRMLHVASAERSIYRMLDDTKTDVIFSSQSSIFTAARHTKMIHFTYDFNDLFVYSPFTRMTDWRPDLERIKFYSEVYKTGRYLARKLVRGMFGIARPRPDLLCTPSSIILRILYEHGYKNCTTFVPPARQYSPKTKKRQVIQVSRIVQTKRIERFFEAARQLPNEKFILIGKFQKGVMHYGKRLMENIPSNVEFVEGNLKDHVDLLRESSVYAYTGRDRAIMLTVAEAISAGCYPIVAADSSALDVANISKIGTSFNTVSQLVREIQFRLDNPMDPEVISKYAEPFKPEYFESWVQKVATNG